MADGNGSQETTAGATDNPNRTLVLCVHCEILGVSAVARPDSESPDILHCTLCKLSFYFVTEAARLIVTQIKPYTGET
ncbi:MAG TPA: hypothetical protein VMW38_19560 [Terriglobia bacterium]|nr:hypothetical protein [Terriglobia bacterium]